jgi:transcriptional regulator with PAS, ATPase and Fis domain
MSMIEITDTNYHRLLKRQIRKSLPPELAEHPGMHDFLLSVHQAYTEYQDDLGRVELILEQSSGELFKANRELRRIAQEKTEEAALTSKRLEEVVGSISEVLVQLDRDGNIIYLNEAWKQLPAILYMKVWAAVGWISFPPGFKGKVAEILSSEIQTVNDIVQISTPQGEKNGLALSLTPYFVNGQYMPGLPALSRT